jgi:malate/lactate dehydrogenase
MTSSAAGTAKIAIVGAGHVGVTLAGVLRVMPVPLSEDERNGLHRSARAVRSVIDQLGL